MALVSAGRSGSASGFERRLLQGVVLVGGLVPVAAGLAGAVLGAAVTGDTLSASGDSHFRYLSGLLLAIGFGFWSTLPHIERRGERFRLLTFIVFVGGVCRVVALASGRWPSPEMLFGAGMEIVVTPLLCLWQWRVSRA